METRRLSTEGLALSRRARVLPWALTTGMSLISGLQANRRSYSLMGSLLTAFIIPTAMKLIGHKKKDEGLWLRVGRVLFPSLRI